MHDNHNKTELDALTQKTKILLASQSILIKQLNKNKQHGVLSENAHCTIPSVLEAEQIAKNYLRILLRKPQRDMQASMRDAFNAILRDQPPAVINALKTLIQHELQKTQTELAERQRNLSHQNESVSFMTVQHRYLQT